MGRLGHPFNLTSGITQSHVFARSFALLSVVTRANCLTLVPKTLQANTVSSYAPNSVKHSARKGASSKLRGWHLAQSVTGSRARSYRSWGLFVRDSLTILSIIFKQACITYWIKYVHSQRRVDLQSVTITLHVIDISLSIFFFFWWSQQKFFVGSIQAFLWDPEILLGPRLWGWSSVWITVVHDRPGGCRMGGLPLGRGLWLVFWV